MRWYTKTHDWLERVGAGGVFRTGVTRPLARRLDGPVTRLELPTPGTRLRLGQVCGTIGSARNTFRLYATATGRVLETNERLTGSFEVLDADPEGEGWLYTLEHGSPLELEALCDEVEYRRFADDQDG